MEKSILKVKNLSNHLVKNGVAMATCDALRKIFPESCSPINFS